MGRMLSLPWNDWTDSGEMGSEAGRLTIMLQGDQREHLRF